MKQIRLLSYEKALGFGVTHFFRHIFTFFMVWACSLVLIAIATAGTIGLGSILFYLIDILKHTSSSSVIYWVLLPVVLIIAYFVLNLALITIFAYNYQMLRFSMAIYEGNPLPWTQFFSFTRKPFLPYCLARSFRGIKVIVGLALLVIPGIYLALKNYFAGYSILDRSTNSIFEDARISAQATQDLKWQLIGFIAILWIAQLFATLTLFFFVPILYLAQVHAYKQLTVKD